MTTLRGEVKSGDVPGETTDEEEADVGEVYDEAASTSLLLSVPTHRKRRPAPEGVAPASVKAVQWSYSIRRLKKQTLAELRMMR
jgi:hypothetical protein